LRDEQGGEDRPLGADPVGALAMLPVVLWQGWETLKEAREGGR
jgi:hypothetical protein